MLSTFFCAFPDVDATLPHGPDRALMCLSTGCRRELWPALLEKAVRRPVVRAASPSPHARARST